MLRPAIFLLSLLTLPLRANLGDTIAQCVARYGQPIHYTEASDKLPFGTISFYSTGYGLTVFVLNDIEVGARVSKADKSAFGPAEMQNIMTADSGGGSWTSTVSQDPTCSEWTRSDKATVIYDRVKHILIFTSPQMAQALNSKR